MDINRATELLLALADGIDPITGNRLPDESVYNNPEIIRAIHCLLRQLQANLHPLRNRCRHRLWIRNHMFRRRLP